ncbi:enoyl-CoA hydratase/isomerase [Thecamonas trahens ATCC 50062]|uniref:Enoyl-CoA hydratase/isomerase n=1 Tax=Thecamonas trahens ATCC 50062 TaxID=461836 RepID=A0A0L0DAF0_THETB|nr:enoyl-CoA hydratase/isomerase [Thecamonas trahens ATCC 50062]KNC49334.1 enoyl-CoA hydratase/isomerase [Thecamonas trahens ATCC 50062]|eukprot:XP_013758042.1 enoyl-CoA hydratase/isomerase [Thecamonas trahens ATCC 50062]
MRYTTITTARPATTPNTLVITLARPAVKNAFNQAMYADMTAALDDAAHSDEVAVVVITGAGSFFSSGADLKEMAEMAGPPLGSDDSDDDDGDDNKLARSAATPRTRGWHAPVGRFMSRIITFPKILIAAVNGPAVGVGATLLLHCDVVVAAESASMWLPFARIAVVPEFCSSLLLPKILGPSLAGEMLYAQAKLTAPAAARANWVSTLVPEPADVLPAALECAQRMTAPPLASDSLALFKAMVRDADRPTLLALCERELDLLDMRIDNGDVARAAMAFMMGRGSASALPPLSKL